MDKNNIECIGVRVGDTTEYHYRDDSPTLGEGGENSEIGEGSGKNKFEQILDSISTESEQGLNSVSTEPEQISADMIKQIEQKAIEKYKKKSQTLAGRTCLNNRPKETPKSYVQSYIAIAELLADRRLIEQETDSKRIKTFFSVPEPIQNRVRQELGCTASELSNYIIDKVWVSMQYEKKVKPSTFWTCLISTIMLAGTMTYLAFTADTARSQAKEIKAEAVATTPQQRIADSLYIELWARTKKFNFYPFRYDQMLSDKKFLFGDESTREEIMQQHMQEQKEAVKQNQKHFKRETK